jgi:hypothetical protein
MAMIPDIPNGNAATLTVDISKVASSSNTAKCWWLNASSGVTTLTGSHAHCETDNFAASDLNDSVPVINDSRWKLG